MIVEIFQVLLLVIATLDPLKSIDQLYTTTHHHSPSKRMHEAYLSFGVIIVLTIVLFVLDTHFLKFLRMSLEDFQVVTGILLFIVAFSILLNKTVKEHIPFLTTPLSKLPLLIAVLLISIMTSTFLIALIGIVVSFIITGLLLYYSQKWHGKINKTLILHISAVLAIILLSWAVVLIRNGMAWY